MICCSRGQAVVASHRLAGTDLPQLPNTKADGVGIAQVLSTSPPCRRLRLPAVRHRYHLAQQGSERMDTFDVCRALLRGAYKRTCTRQIPRRREICGKSSNCWGRVRINTVQPPHRWNGSCGNIPKPRRNSGLPFRIGSLGAGGDILRSSY